MLFFSPSHAAGLLLPVDHLRHAPRLHSQRRCPAPSPPSPGLPLTALGGRMCWWRGGGGARPCGGGCMRGGGQRVFDSSCDGGRRSPAVPYPPQTQQPYPCDVVPRALPVTATATAAAAAAAAAAVYASPVSPPAFPTGILPPPIGTPLGTPPSPCYGGCSCGASTASSPGACRVHERVFACPPPPPPVTCGATERESVGPLAGGDGEVAVPVNDDQEVWHPRDDTSEEIKEESVKELLLRCVVAAVASLPAVFLLFVAAPTAAPATAADARPSQLASFRHLPRGASAALARRPRSCTFRVATPPFARRPCPGTREPLSVCLSTFTTHVHARPLTAR